MVLIWFTLILVWFWDMLASVWFHARSHWFSWLILLWFHYGLWDIGRGPGICCIHLFHYWLWEVLGYAGFISFMIDYWQKCRNAASYRFISFLYQLITDVSYHFCIDSLLLEVLGECCFIIVSLLMFGRCCFIIVSFSYSLSFHYLLIIDS